jgi:hypothetical protein
MTEVQEAAKSGAMKRHGSLVYNLELALLSARRLREQSVYPDTVKHWSDLVDYARLRLDQGNLPDMPVVRRIADELAAEIAGRR